MADWALTDWTLTDWTLQDWTMVTFVENLAKFGPVIRENARHAHHYKLSPVLYWGGVHISCSYSSLTQSPVVLR